MIKLLISDLDGTLLKPTRERQEDENSNVHGKVIPEFNVDALNKLSKNNIEFAVATGRMQSQCKDILKPIENYKKYWITQNGVFIQDNDLNSIYEKVFTKQEAWNIYSYLEQRGFNPFFTDIDSFYLNSDKLSHGSYNYQICYSKDYKDKVDTNYIKFNQENLDMIDISNFGLETAQIDLLQMEDLESLLNREIIDAEIFITSGISIDIVPRNVSKAHAIKKLAKILDLSLDEIAFVGDSGNDEPALKLLKNSFAMSHARDKVKQSATYIVDSVADVVDKVLQLNSIMVD